MDPTLSPAALRLDPQRIFRCTLIVICVFVVSHLGVKALGRHGVALDPYLVRLVDLDQEGNLPAFVAACQLLLAGLVGLVLAWAEAGGKGDRSILQRPVARGWFFLGLGMLVMGVDEAVQFHEQGNRIANQGWLPASVWLRFAWVIPGLGVVAGSGLALVGFLRRIPPDLAWRLVLSGGVFVFGALGCELLGSYVASRYSGHSINYAAVVALEETAEFLGIALYIRSCLNYAQTRFGELVVAWRRA